MCSHDDANTPVYKSDYLKDLDEPAFTPDQVPPPAPPAAPVYIFKGPAAKEPKEPSIFTGQQGCVVGSAQVEEPADYEYQHPSQFIMDLNAVLTDGGVFGPRDRAAVLSIAGLVYTELHRALIKHVGALSREFKIENPAEKVAGVIAELVHLVADTDAIQPEFNAAKIFDDLNLATGEVALPGVTQMVETLRLQEHAPIREFESLLESILN